MLLEKLTVPLRLKQYFTYSDKPRFYTYTAVFKNTCQWEQNINLVYAKFHSDWVYQTRYFGGICSLRMTACFRLIMHRALPWLPAPSTILLPSILHLLSQSNHSTSYVDFQLLRSIFSIFRWRLGVPVGYRGGFRGIERRLNLLVPLSTVGTTTHFNIPTLNFPYTTYVSIFTITTGVSQ